jgi:hypothetical protein
VKTLRTLAWGLGLVAIFTAVAFCLDGEYAERELRRVFRVLPGGRR